MDARQLRYFAAIYQQKNLSHAAQQCNVAQSAISHHLSNLEAELGVKLFDRMPRGMEPTPAGARLFEHAQAILRSMRAAAEDVLQLSEDIIGEIQVGLPFSVIDAVGVELMTAFHSNHPRARLIIHEALSSELHRQLLAGEHDLILCYNAPADDRVKLGFIHEEELCCAGRSEFLGATNDPIDFEEAVALPQIMLRRGEASRSISTHVRLLESLHRHAILELNSVNGMRKALLAGIGTAACPLITVRDLVASGSIVARPLVNPGSMRKLHHARLSERVPTRLMDAVLEELQRLIAEQVNDGRWPAKR